MCARLSWLFAGWPAWSVNDPLRRLRRSATAMALDDDVLCTFVSPSQRPLQVAPVAPRPGTGLYQAGGAPQVLASGAFALLADLVVRTGEARHTPETGFHC